MIISDRVDTAIADNPDKAFRIGIMGGTFDPIHFGHLICAEQAREQFALDYVVFMPTGNPAFKAEHRVTPAEDRFNMAVIATRKNPHFDVSRVEVEREGVTYTYDTLLYFKKKLPEHIELFFITGADAITNLLKWKNPDQIVQLAHFVAATRPGYDYSELREYVANSFGFADKVSFFEVPGLAISSTDLRERIVCGKSITYLTPVSVADYIRTHRLYLDDEAVANSAGGFSGSVACGIDGSNSPSHQEETGFKGNVTCGIDGSNS